jgi:CHAT domain-containing protein
MCPAVVVSQWKVDSASTTELMLDFHKDLTHGQPGTRRMDVARSLRVAALKLMQTPEYRHPFYWAGFVVVGAGFPS